MVATKSAGNPTPLRLSLVIMTQSKAKSFTQKEDFPFPLPPPLWYNGTVNHALRKGGRETMTITVDTSRCIGCGMCAYAAPGVFAVVGKYSTVVGQPEPDKVPRVRDAANGCPVNAIGIAK